SSPRPGAPSATKPPTTKPPTTKPAVIGPTLARSLPVSIDLPSIGVHSSLQYVGLNPDGTIAVPQPGPKYNEAAWYKYSPTPGQVGPSVIEGHIDSAAEGPSVFFRLGALKPGDTADVTLADGTVAVFRITGVRQYPKASFPTHTVYGNTDFAALRLLTCGGSFDYTTHHYLSNTVVFASLTGSHPASQAAGAQSSGSG
ncbi:MAG: class F sortase, partial [Acidimicrobiales bacterium]